MTRSMAARVCVLGAVLALGVDGCAQKGAWFDLSSLVRPAATPADPAPTPDSPEAALRLFEWSYNNKSLSGCRDLFTADYRFHFSPFDSAGGAYRGTPWTRDDELISTTHLFVGGSANVPPATTIRLALDRNFFVYADPRTAAWDPQGHWHKYIRTQVALDVQTGGGSAIEISGTADFYLVRSDSAAIPTGPLARSLRPDSTRWWINGWDDGTAQAGPSPGGVRGGADPIVARRRPVLDAQPSSNKTWGWLKVLYR